MDVTNGSSCYHVGALVANIGGQRVYTCLQEGSDHQCLLKAPPDASYNGELDREAYILRELKMRADEVEQQFAEEQGPPTSAESSSQRVRLNYNLGFPRLVDSFVCTKQGNRRLNVLAFRKVKQVGEMVPLTNITQKDRRRVDLQTSAWIAGRVLKTLTFAHREGIAVVSLTGDNIVIEPNRHYGVVFDWTQAKTTAPGNLSEAERQADISAAARAIVVVLGGDPDKGFIPDDDTDHPGRAYAEYLIHLAQGGESDTVTAYDRFYELVDATWPRQFYPFTTLPLTD